VPEQRRERDGDGHGDHEQPPRQAPRPGVERPVELEPCAHERDDDDEFGEPLRDLDVLDGVGRLDADRE
jgi:hypothetical protein